MSLIVNGVTLPSSAVITCNGVTLSSIVCNAVEVWKKGTLTLKEVVFNASGTFTMPSGVVDNQIIVGCTGGGGGSNLNDEDVYGGNGAGRVVSTITMSSGQTATVTVGARGLGYTSGGGTSSFTGASSCAGGVLGSSATPTNGGGKGSAGSSAPSTASNCPATLSLKNEAVDSTTGLWKAKSFSGGNYYSGGGGGGGCYGIGAGSTPAAANSGAGGYRGDGHGGSGKVVVWYYTYV